jgi:hypothetical protein
MLLHRGRDRIVLNLARVGAIDAGGMGELARVYRMAQAAGARLRITRATGRVRTLLRLARLLEVLTSGSMIRIAGPPAPKVTVRTVAGSARIHQVDGPRGRPPRGRGPLPLRGRVAGVIAELEPSSRVAGRR